MSNQERHKLHYIATCLNGQHKLINIISQNSSAAPDAMLVVRWCKACGAIVIDTDVDGRTFPGDVMKMKFPDKSAAEIGKAVQ